MGANTELVDILQVTFSYEYASKQIVLCFKFHWFKELRPGLNVLKFSTGLYNKWLKKANISCLSESVCAKCINIHSQKLQIWVFKICIQVIITQFVTQYATFTVMTFVNNYEDLMGRNWTNSIVCHSPKIWISSIKALEQWTSFWYIYPMIPFYCMCAGSKSNWCYIFVNWPEMWTHNNHSSDCICIPIFSQCEIDG